MTFFDRIPLDGISEFSLFSVPYFFAVIVSLTGIVLCYYCLPKLQGKSYEPVIRYSIIGYLILSSLYKQWFFFVSDVPWYVHLPEATCGLAIFTGTLSLITKNRTLFVLTFFWSWGAFTALLAPNLLEGPDRYYFYQFFLRHSLIVISALYIMRVFDYKVYKSDFKTYFFVTLTLSILGLIFSLIINDPDNLNMYYTLQPAVNNPFLDWILQISHPLYVVFWLSSAALLGYLYGLPFYSREES